MAVAFTAVAGIPHANAAVQRRTGKVLIVRGAFTVFSLGLDDLGEKLRRRGVDAEVVPASLALPKAAELRAAYRRDPNGRPLVIIGHSLGGNLAPDIARELQADSVLVKLIVIVDATHETSIPANVEQCLNLYQSGNGMVVHGLPVRGESRATEILNVNVDRYRPRGASGVNHFSIDSSSWIHEIIIREVLNVCPPVRSQPTRQSDGTTTPQARPAKEASRTESPAEAPAENADSSQEEVGPLLVPSGDMTLFDPAPWRVADPFRNPFNDPEED